MRQNVIGAKFLKQQTENAKVDYCQQSLCVYLQTQLMFWHSVEFSSAQDGIYALGKANYYAPSLRSFPKAAFKTVPVFVWLTMALLVLSRKVV